MSANPARIIFNVPPVEDKLNDYTIHDYDSTKLVSYNKSV